nr:cytochrome p450 [Quercus suber]
MKKGKEPMCLIDFWMQETVKKLTTLSESDETAVPPPPNTSDVEIESYLFDFLFIAQDSSTSSFLWAMTLLDSHPKIDQACGFFSFLHEATKGNKPSSTFKASSFALVAKEISAQFGVERHPSFVDNWMQTLRTLWSTIQTIRKKSGFGWDDNLKMITCDAKTYQEEVMAHRKHVEYLNKKIEMYDELAIVVGKDTATNGFSKSYVDIENEPDNGDSAEFVADNVEEGVVEKGKNAVESSTIGSGISKSRKKGRAPSNADDSVLTDLSDQLKEIDVALKEINQGPVDYTTLYNEVMAMMADGYSEEMLAIAFDHLCENEKATWGFLAKNARLRKL